MFLTWLQFRALEISDGSCATDWIELYFFAIPRNMGELQDTAMNLLQDLYRKEALQFIPLDEVRLIFSNSEPGTAKGLRRWSVAMVFWGLLNHHYAVSDVASIFEQRELTEGFLRHLQHCCQVRNGMAYFEDDPRYRLSENDIGEEFVSLQCGFPECFFHNHWEYLCSDCVWDAP
jgi:hypothetical protein